MFKPSFLHQADELNHTKFDKFKHFSHPECIDTCANLTLKRMKVSTTLCVKLKEKIL